MFSEELRDGKLIYWQIAALIAASLGIYARFIGLNTWSLAVDEYFIAKSTDFILDKGVPQFDCGGYYMRGLLMQYFIVAERLLGVPVNLAVRLPSALSFFIALPAVFILSRRLSGNITAYACIILFSLSAWEIEFARFGRMYALFQAVFIWYLIFLLKAVVDDNRPSRYFMYSLTLIALLLWEGAVFMALLNFLPARLDYKKIKWKDWLLSGVIFIIVYLFLTTNFRHMWEDNPFPLNLDVEPPKVPTDTIASKSFINKDKITWLLIATIPFIISVWGFTNILKEKGLHWIIKTYLFSLIILSLSHLFGVIIYISIVFLLYDPSNFIKTIKIKYKLILFVTLSWLFIWVAYFTNKPDFINIIANEGKIIFVIKLIKILFGFPNIFNSFIYLWLPVMPVFLSVLASSFIIFIYSTIKNKSHDKYFSIRFVSILIVSLIYIVGLLKTPYFQTRYLFFIYPPLLILTISFIKVSICNYWTRNYLHSSMAISIFSIILAANDWNINHVLHVDGYTINFRTIYSKEHNLTKHYYPRRDKADAANYVNNNMEKDDIVIITEIPFDYYLDKIDYVYRNYNHKEFWAISCAQGKLDRWTNKPLIYKENDLYRIINNTKGNVWLILLGSRKDQDQITIREKYKTSIVHKSPDKVYIVYKVKRK